MAKQKPDWDVVEDARTAQRPGTASVKLDLTRCLIVTDATGGVVYTDAGSAFSQIRLTLPVRDVNWHDLHSWVEAQVETPAEHDALFGAIATAVEDHFILVALRSLVMRGDR